MTRRNLLFIMTDHQRADSLGGAQCGLEVTPRLNALAEHSVVFRRAYTTCPLCVPARTALATGLYPTRNGVVFNDWPGVRAGDHLTLHERLSRAGYRLGHVGVHHVRVKPDLRERVDFQGWTDQQDFQQHLASRNIDYLAPLDAAHFKRPVEENQEGRRVNVAYSSAATAIFAHGADEFQDAWFARRACEFLRDSGEGPFALFVNLWAPHPPLSVPEPYASRFDPAHIELPGNVGIPAKGEPPGRRKGIAAQLAEGLSEDDWRRTWAAHLGLVNLADELVGRILDALPRADETVVVFTVDHGDHLGQHAMYQKMEMYEPAIRVPLIVHVPGMRSRSVDAPVSHLDLLPTLCGLLDLDAPPSRSAGSTSSTPPTRPNSTTSTPIHSR